jgi:hypothetical protein
MAASISAETVRRKMESGQDVMFVCAYDDDAKCKNTGVSDGLSFSQFKRQQASIPKDRQIVFFCA